LQTSIGILQDLQRKVYNRVDYGSVNRGCDMISYIYMRSKADISHLNLLHGTEDKNTEKLQCGPMPNVMAALLNISGALCSAPQSLLTPTTRVPCSNPAKARNPLKLAGVPQN